MKNATKINKKEQMAAAEYDRLIELYKTAGVDEIKLKINDSWIKEVAAIYATLQLLKDLPTIIYDKKNPHQQRETAAGKSKVKLLAQYSAAMQKLNKDLFGTLNGDDADDLSEFE